MVLIPSAPTTISINLISDTRSVTAVLPVPHQPDSGHTLRLRFSPSQTLPFLQIGWELQSGTDGEGVAEGEAELKERIKQAVDNIREGGSLDLSVILDRLVGALASGDA
jgi:hypothetical protein